MNGFGSLSRPEKHWVMAHPFKAKYAYRVSRHVRQVCDSLEKAGVLSDGDGGQLDAFRHAYWMACLVQKMSPKKARKLGKAHEKGNYLGWKNKKSEDGSRADSLMCDMDLKNNESGIAVGLKLLKSGNCWQVSKSLIDRVLKEIENGQLVMMKKDESGNFYDCDGKKIDMSDYNGKWSVPKCEVESNAPVKRG